MHTFSITEIIESIQLATDMIRNMGPVSLAIKDIKVIGSAGLHGAGNDIDVMVLVTTTGEISGGTVLLRELEADSWELGGSPMAGGDQRWASFKKEYGPITINVLLTFDDEYFDLAVKSLTVCQYLKRIGIPVNKAVRVAIHRILMDEANAEDAHTSTIGLESIP